MKTSKTLLPFIMGLGLVLTGCADVAPLSASDFNKYLDQKIGLADKNKMNVSANSEGTMCYGGEDLTSVQYKKACDAALSKQREKIKKQEEDAKEKAAQEAAAKKKDDAERAARIAALQAHPSRHLVDYEVRMTGLYDTWAHIEFVRQCDLRSPYWFDTLFQFVQIRKAQVMSDSNLSTDESAAVYDFAQKHYNSVLQDYYNDFRHDPSRTCQRLAASEKIRFLDQLQRQVTSNYH